MRCETSCWNSATGHERSGPLVQPGSSTGAQPGGEEALRAATVRIWFIDWVWRYSLTYHFPCSWSCSSLKPSIEPSAPHLLSCRMGEWEYKLGAGWESESQGEQNWVKIWHYVDMEIWHSFDIMKNKVMGAMIKVARAGMRVRLSVKVRFRMRMRVRWNKWKIRSTGYLSPGGAMFWL